jgi:hypothetical protein
LWAKFGFIGIDLGLYMCNKKVIKIKAGQWHNLGLKEGKKYLIWLVVNGDLNNKELN